MDIVCQFSQKMYKSFVLQQLETVLWRPVMIVWLSSVGPDRTTGLIRDCPVASDFLRTVLGAEGYFRTVRYRTRIADGLSWNIFGSVRDDRTAFGTVPDEFRNDFVL